MWLGAHVGIADGLGDAPALGRRIGCEAIQIFSKSPQMWRGPAIAPEAAERFRAAVDREGLRATAIHHGYLLNLANPKPALLAQSRKAFLDEIARAELLQVSGLILHPGAHLGDGVEAGVARIAENLNWAFEQTPEGKVPILLENAAGQGTTLGSTFEELAGILAKVHDRSRVGIAIDTCHLFASGVDFLGDTPYGAMIDHLDQAMGIREVRAFHFNDAKAPIGSHLDRHENIGKGMIGRAGFAPFLNDRRWENVPAYLETPLGEDGYGFYERDLATLRSWIEGAGATVATPATPQRKGAPKRPRKSGSSR